MDPNTLKALQGAAGAGGGGPEYVEDVYSTEVYDGDGSNNITVTNGLDMDGKGGLVWTKSRTQSQAHILIDTVRGKTKYIKSNSDAQEQTSAYFITNFLSDGYVTGCCDGAADAVNWGGQNFVSWSFRQAPGFFDTVTYTGASSNATQTINHDLGCVPGMILVKNLTKVDVNLYSWAVYHKHVDSSAPQGYRMLLDTDGARSSTSSTDEWGNTAPTASGFTVGGSSLTNLDGHDFVAYLFADGADAGAQIFGDDGDESIVKCGEFDAGGSGDVAVTLGFEPQWLMVKQYSGAGGDWFIFDNMRGFGAKGGTNYMLRAQSTNDEGSYADYFCPSSDGFVVDGTSLGNHQYVYMAIRRGPMKTPEDATKVFTPSAVTVSGGTQRTTSFPIDLVMGADRGSSGQGFALEDRLRGFARENTTNVSAKLKTAVTDDENTFQSPIVYEVNTNTLREGDYFSGYSAIFYYFRRAPEFFDIVCYEGTSSARMEDHNLGVTPELLIVKSRSHDKAWMVWNKDLDSDEYLVFDNNYNAFTNNAMFSTTAPTPTQFALGTDSDTNGSGKTYVAYLFASCPGVSKVGSETVGSSAIDVDCDFTGGARFVMIKRTDAYDNWYVYDTTRGIAIGNDDYLLINEPDAEGQNDYIDPLPAGFKINTSLPAGDYIYLAIA